jgi:GNAT superfamily N-acetyltransferase
LNTWLQTTARQHKEKKLSQTFVLVDDNKPEVIAGFYALAARGMVHKETLPPPMAKKLPSNIPGYTLARLAVASDQAGKGYGGELLIDAMRRAKLAASQVGGPFLFVDAKDQQAASFYLHFGFTPLPNDSLTLVIPMASIDDD